MTVSLLPPTRATVESTLRSQYAAVRAVYEERLGPTFAVVFSDPALEWNQRGPNGLYTHTLSWTVTCEQPDRLVDPEFYRVPEPHRLGIETEHPL